MKLIGRKVAELEGKKQKAVEGERYENAMTLKRDIDKLRKSCVALGIGSLHHPTWGRAGGKGEGEGEEREGGGEVLPPHGAPQHHQQALPRGVAGRARGLPARPHAARTLELEAAADA